MSWLGIDVCSSGDTDVAYLVSGCELAWFPMCTLLVMQTVAHLVSGCELAWFLMCTLVVTLWPVLFQLVSWPGFECLLFW